MPLAGLAWPSGFAVRRSLRARLPQRPTPRGSRFASERGGVPSGPNCHPPAPGARLADPSFASGCAFVGATAERTFGPIGTEFDPAHSPGSQACCLATGGTMAAVGDPADGHTSGPLLQTLGKGGRVTASRLRHLAQAIEALPNRSGRPSSVVPPSPPVPPAHAPPPLAPVRGSQSLRAGFLSTVASAGAAAKFRKTIAATNSPLDHLYGSSLKAKVRDPAHAAARKRRAAATHLQA